MWSERYVYLLFTALLCGESGPVGGVTISELRVPSVQLGAADSAILDCVYDLKEHEKIGIVVRWYFEQQLEPFYQWIPQNAPQVAPSRVNTIDVGYQADTDEYKAHRAVRMVNLSTNMTGVYRCSVSTFENDDEKSARMIVYAPARLMDINYSKPDENLLNVSCKAEGVFPEPKLKLYQVTKSTKSALDYKIETVLIGGLYSTHVYSLLEESELSTDVSFVCSLSIPDTTYEEERTTSLPRGVPTKTFLDDNSGSSLLSNVGFLCLMSVLVIMR